MAATHFHWADWTLFSLTLLTSLGIGVYYSVTGTKQKSPKEYLLAGRSLGALPVAVSIVMSYISAVLVLGNTAEMYTAGIQYWLACIGSSLAFFVSAAVFVPFFYNLNLTSSFEYFELRYHSKLIRVLASVMFIISSAVYMGLVLFSPATALQAATDIPVWASILATGLIATVYTTMGGMRAVVWTDFIQGIILVAGIITILVVGMLEVGGIGEVWKISDDGGRLHLFDFNPDPTIRLTFWSVIIGRFFISLLTVGVGQTSIQRYSSAASIKDARLSAYLNCPGIVIVYTLTCLIGLTVYSYYEVKGCDPLANKDISSSNQLLPYFIMEVVNYPGIPGVFLATLVSGALSSLSSSLNSMAAVTWKDMVEPLYKGAAEHKQANVIKAFTFVYGLLAIGMAFVAEFLGGHVLQATNSIVGGIGGPSLGMFILGMFFPWSNWIGTGIGCLIGFAMTSWVSMGAYMNYVALGRLPTSTDNCIHDVYNFTTASSHSTYIWTTELPPADDEVFGLYRMSYMYNSAFGCIITLVTGIIISLLTGATDPRDIDNNLFIPWYQSVCCCLPLSWRNYCHCGGQDYSMADEKPPDNAEDTTLVCENISYRSVSSQKTLIENEPANKNLVHQNGAAPYDRTSV